MNLNGTNLAKGGESTHQTIESYQQTHNTWEEQAQQATQQQHIISNYSGHHMKGSFQKNNKHMGNANTHTQQTNKNNNNDFQTSLAQSPPEPD